MSQNIMFLHIFYNFRLLRVDESGLQLRTKRRLSRKPKCYNEGGNFQSVRIYDCQSIFILYLVGIVLSLIILVSEKFAFKYSTTKKIKLNENKLQIQFEELNDRDIGSQLADTYLP